MQPMVLAKHDPFFIIRKSGKKQIDQLTETIRKSGFKKVVLLSETSVGNLPREE